MSKQTIAVIVAALMAISSCIYYGGRYFIKSRAESVRNGMSCYCDMGG